MANISTTMKTKKDLELEEIWHQVPPDYYQKGVEKNVLQRLWHKGKLHAVNLLIEEVDVEPRDILDVGCASGWFLSEIAKNYPLAKCTGVDAYKKSIDYGTKQYKNLTLLTIDAHKLPFAKASFDIVICAEVLEHVEHPEIVLSEIKRVLKKDGAAIIEMDTGNVFFQIAWYWWTNMRKGVWKDAHIHAFNTRKLERMIKQTGFIIQKKKIFNKTMAVAFLLKK